MSSSPDLRILRPDPRRRMEPMEFSTVADLATAIPVEVPRTPEELVTQPTVDPVAAVEAAVNAGFREGYQIGHAEGLRVGQAEGREAGTSIGRAEAMTAATSELRAALGPALAVLDEAVAQLDAADAVTLREIEQEVVDLAFAVAKSLLERELSIDTYPARDSLRRALALVPDRGTVVVRVNPVDLGTLGDVATMAPARVIELVADGSVERGGCVVDVDACRVDAQLGTALERVRIALGAMPLGGDAPS